MQTVSGIGVSYEVTGEHEVEAARQLEEGLSAVMKRRSSNIQGEIDLIIADVINDFGVDIKTVV